MCDDVPSGAGRSGGAKLTNPLGGTAHQVDGADRYICASLSVDTGLIDGIGILFQLHHAVQTIYEQIDSQRN